MLWYEAKNLTWKQLLLRDSFNQNWKLNNHAHSSSAITYCSLVKNTGVFHFTLIAHLMFKCSEFRVSVLIYLQKVGARKYQQIVLIPIFFFFFFLGGGGGGGVQNGVFHSRKFLPFSYKRGLIFLSSNPIM